MNEADARVTLLVRAWETAPPGSVPWADEDRAWASRSAARAAGEQASDEAYLATRARLALGRITEREPAASRTLRALRWRPWAAWALAAISLVLGVATDAFGASREVNVLAPPLLALMLWNLTVYAAGLLRRVAGRSATGPLARLAAPLLARLARLGASARPAEGAGSGNAQSLARFAGDWTRASAGLNAARVARALHFSAIAFALGALAGMYLRGLAFEYRAGWESTFLDAEQVRAILGVVLGPASAITGIGLPDAAALQAMRLPGPGAQAAPWIHLYALTVALVVVLPRLALAARELAIERRLAARFPLPLDDPYFTALARSLRGEATTVLVLPCNHRLSPAAQQSLGTLAARLFGPATRTALLDEVAYGDEEAAGERLREAIERPRAPGTEPVAAAAVFALLSATATPEPETHGVFVDALAAARPAGVPLLALVDESAFVARFGDDPLAAKRREERRLAWERMLTAHGHVAAFLDLERADPAAEREVGEALARAARASAPTSAAR
jgi:hypothetical protein